jgi:hypothetical protein
MNPRTFQALYCARWHVPPARFRADLLSRTLYPHARPFAPAIGWLNRQHFQADFEFVDDVAYLEKVEGFQDALDCYTAHFSNRGFLRAHLRLRISARRMWRIVREILPGTPGASLARRMEARDSVTPFGRKDLPPRPAAD